VKVEFIEGPGSGEFLTLIKRTGISQRETLEGTIVNLCICLGIKTVHKKMSGRGGTFYQPVGQIGYQSASNTILELTEKLLNYHYKEHA